MTTVLGLDTSNYTTSAAIFDGEKGVNAGKLLEVPPGGLGLRQSEALFQHIRALPERLSELGALQDISAVCASTCPRAVDGSYMPCFLAGESVARCLSRTLDVPFFSVSHQQGHLAAAAWSAGRMELLDKPFLAWHLSGGTTELLYVLPDGANVRTERIGGTTDLSAGQLIDRTGRLLGLAFPAGKALSALYVENEMPCGFPVKLLGLEFSLSGMENQVQQRLACGESAAEIAHFVLDTLTDVVLRCTRAAMQVHPGLPVLCSGGVASNTHLRRVLRSACGAWFAEPKYSTDNALGTAILGRRMLERGEKFCESVPSTPSQTSMPTSKTGWTPTLS